MCQFSLCHLIWCWSSSGHFDLDFPHVGNARPVFYCYLQLKNSMFHYSALYLCYCSRLFNQSEQFLCLYTQLWIPYVALALKYLMLQYHMICLHTSDWNVIAWVQRSDLQLKGKLFSFYIMCAYLWTCIVRKWTEFNAKTVYRRS